MLFLDNRRGENAESKVDEGSRKEKHVANLSSVRDVPFGIDDGTIMKLSDDSQ